ncbi:MAG: ribosomal protein S19 family protein [archaeon]
MAEENKMEDMKVRIKEKQYRGLTVDQLKALGTREFSSLVKSRPRRAILRNYNVIDAFVKKCRDCEANKKSIRTHDRALTIVPALIGLTVSIHNGKDFMPVKITEEMLGHRLGEFALTRKAVKHGAAGVGATKSSSSLSVK